MIKELIEKTNNREIDQIDKGFYIIFDIEKTAF